MSEPLGPSGEALLRHLVQIVKSQQSEIDQLRLEVGALHQASKKSHGDLSIGLTHTIDESNAQLAAIRADLLKVAEAVRAVELTALEGEQLAAAKMRSLEHLSVQQITINAQRVADTAHLQARFNTLMDLRKEGGLQTSAAPASPPPPPSAGSWGGMNSSSSGSGGSPSGREPPLDAARGPAGVGELGLRFQRLEQQFHHLLAVFEIPNTYATADGRPMTTQTIEVLAAQPRSKRVKFLHGLPCFHVLWAELFRLQQQRQVPYVISPTARGAAAAPAAGGGGIASPARAVVEAGRFHPAGIVAIPGLGVDVVAFEGQRGVVVHRVVRAGALDGAGCVEGDTIIAVGDVVVVGCFHFADLIEEAQRIRSNRLMLSVIPSGRSTAMPLSIRVAFQ
jgi:hypothetical protein